MLLLLFSLLSFISLAIPNIAYAQDYLCGKGIKTPIGCVPIDSTTSLFSFFLRWGLGIAGGIAFLLVIYASFIIMTSTGNPERLQSGKELLTAAFTGMLFLIFSIFILRIIGVELFNIPIFI